MLLYRRIKREFLVNREFRKYLGYAVGEILLVIAGILIALQIDTWYENKKTQERLNEYLANIERDIGDDVRRLEQLKAVRTSAAFEAISTIIATGDPDSVDDPDFWHGWFDERFVAMASAALETAQQKLYFIAKSGSYRALSSSGLLSELADAELESMLYDYYRSVERIGSIEEDMNSAIRQLALRFETEVGQDLSTFARREPLFLWNGSSELSGLELREARKLYWELLIDPITQSLLRNQLNQSLLQEYEHLLSLGRTLSAKISGDDADRSSALYVYSSSSTVGHPVLLEDGLLGMHSYGLFEAPANSSDNFHVVDPYIRFEDDALQVQYPGGDDWAYLYILHGPVVALVKRFPKDYSMYDRIRLVLKRDSATECADLNLEIKDIDDAEKGELRSVPLNLTSEWATYTIDLAEFVEADLTRLNVVAGFLFGSAEPCHISIRDVHYLRPD
jgi:hypothetical protein